MPPALSISMTVGSSRGCMEEPPTESNGAWFSRLGLPFEEGRASHGEVLRAAEAANSSAIVQALLDWLDGYVFVLNSQRQVVAASRSVLELVGAPDLSGVLGKRSGEILGCVQVARGPGGCGTSPACRFCGALGATLRAAASSEPVESECRIATRQPRGEQSEKFRVRAARVDGADMIVVALQRASSERAQGDDGWPSGLTYFRTRKLGSGGMGCVFLVADDEGRCFALKTLLAERGGNPTAIARFRHEIDVALPLDHPNIVKTFRSGETANGVHYMVSEYCAGGTLGRWLQDHGVLSFERALFWMIGVARGLHHAWSVGRVVHRDLKPDNLLLDERGTVKIADFGLARRTEADDTRLTQQGAVLGTVLYMSPEQARADHELDARSDLYALGATFYHLLAGAPVFQGSSPSRIMFQHLETAPPPLDRSRPDLPAELCACVDRLLAKSRDDRPASAAELMAELTGIAVRFGVDPAHAPTDDDRHDAPLAVTVIN